ncbi:Sodium channel and clathrin linker 1 [Fukomys damarensis]|uniref:Sodium channel and clathrin linker 1 n=1 Tax=Fukomys damarensis TaxID=885580 RepID=A0A091DYL2_FUKDA|nr:Sodium channel and clathrin linker 1 [Fukomys damarensis]
MATNISSTDILRFPGTKGGTVVLGLPGTLQWQELCNSPSHWRELHGSLSCGQAKLDLRVAVAKVEELTKVTEVLQGQMQKKEEDMVSAIGREDASDRLSQQLQSSIKQLETRLCVTIQEASQLRAENTHLEKLTKDLKAKCNELEIEKYEAILRARDSMQLLEEANLQKYQNFTTVHPFSQLNQVNITQPYFFITYTILLIKQTLR